MTGTMYFENIIKPCNELSENFIFQDDNGEGSKYPKYELAITLAELESYRTCMG